MPKGHAKKQKLVNDRVRSALTFNVNRRLNELYDGEPNKVVALAKHSGVGRSTVQRVLDPDTYGPVGPSIDTVAELARALECEPHELLVPPGD